MIIDLLIIFVIVLVVSGIICTLFGAFVLITLAREVAKPADSSNRINRLRLFWFALTRPELFADSFPWMKRDELDNVK